MHVLLWHLIQLFKKDQVKNSAVVRCGNESEITQLPWAPTLLCDQGMKEHTRCPGDDRGGQPPCCSLFLGPLRGVAGSAGNKSQVPPSLVFSESPGSVPASAHPCSHCLCSHCIFHTHFVRVIMLLSPVSSALFPSFLTSLVALRLKSLLRQKSTVVRFCVCSSSHLHKNIKSQF